MTTDNTAHPAPTPAPVAVPEGGWQERDAVVVHYDDGGHTVLGVWTRRGQSWADSLGRYLPIPHSDDPDPMTESIEQGKGHGRVVYVHAPRPEPVVAPCECPPCPGRGNDGHGMTHCAECCFGTGVEADPGCPAHGEPVVAPLPSEAVRQALVDLLIENRDRDYAASVYKFTPEKMADAILSAGYRLVPEDDEDTVRVPREAVERLHPRGTIRVPVFDEFDSPTQDGCTRCGQSWPCDTMRLLDGTR